ncbi:hypothetical protein niasHT_006073 [Heterodera trifolii]|uniref:Letm1 RBD domain-containing protein n=1 Tax=Heterodera trifolii TaxID=157864 RepID=A0ABD2M887_9BILA
MSLLPISRCSSLFHAARSLACRCPRPLASCHCLLSVPSTAPFSSHFLSSSPVVFHSPTTAVTSIHWCHRRAFASQSTPSAPVPNSTNNTPAAAGGGGIGLYQRYEQWLQNYPALYKLHRLTVDGSKWCYSDLKTFFWLAYGLRKGRITLNDLNARELFIYIQAGSQLVKLSLLAALAVLPAGFPLIIISMLVSPKLVLTRHFWTDWQSQQFQMDDLRRNERKLFPRIVDALRQHNPSSAAALAALEQQLPLTVDQLVALQKSANIVPASLDAYTQQHRFFLKRVHNLPFWTTDGALLRHIKLMRLLDARMAADHAEDKVVDKLSVRELQTHLYLRNLNFSRMTVEQMRSALVQWLDHFKNPSSFDPLLYAHTLVLTQANSADLDRWRKKKGPSSSGTATADGTSSTTSSPLHRSSNSNFLQSLDNLEEWKRMGQRSAELAKRSADAVKPMLRKGTAMAAERLKEAGRAVKKATN